MADETPLRCEAAGGHAVANTKPLRWLMKRKTRGAPGLVCKVANTKPLRWLMKRMERRRTAPDLPVANTKPLRWLMKLYPFKHLIILHAPPSLREPLRTAGQGMPNSI